MKNTAALPSYAPELKEFHRAHHAELQRIIGDLHILPDARVLDVACGDGDYSRWLAKEVGPAGVIVGIDTSHAYLTATGKEHTAGEQLAVAEIESLPFPDNSFDLVWCAQSFVSLDEPVSVLRKMLRALKPGGRIAVLENDSLHEVILPWPPELELAIRTAELQSYATSKQPTHRPYVGRRLAGLLLAAGAERISRTTYSTNCIGPPNDSERAFLMQHLENLGEKIWARLPSRDRAEFRRLLEPSSSDYLLDQPEFEMTWLDFVCIAFKPS